MRNYYYKSFGYVYDQVVAEVLPSQLNQMGYLADCEILLYDLFDGSNQKVTEGGEYDDEEVKRIFTDPKFLKHITEQYLKIEKVGDRLRQGLAFCTDINHSKALCKVLVENGVRAVCVDCDTPPWKRDIIYEDYRQYKIDVICSVNVFCEGFDMPQAEIALLCRPTTSLIVLVQIIGRMLRIFPGKEKCIILDQGNSCNDIVSRYLVDASGFHPYNPIDLSEDKILGIVEPPLPKEIEEKLGGGEGFGRAGILGDTAKIKLPFCEERAQTCVSYAKEHGWNDKQLVEKFLSTCHYPSQSSLYIISNYLMEGSEQKDIDRYTEILYYSCMTYSAIQLGHNINPQALEKLTPAQLQKVSMKARERQMQNKRQDYYLRKKSIVADLDPPNNSYYPQLQIAARKGGDYVTKLFEVLSTELRKRYLKEKSPENLARLDRLMGDYGKILRKYKRAANSDKKI
jgi:hypothetical protein